MSKTKQYESHSTVDRFVDRYDADRYEETDAAISGDNAVGYIDPSMCVTLFGPDVRIHSDVSGSPYGVDLDSYDRAVSVDETSINDDTDGYVFTSPDRETHTIDAEYVELVADVFDCDVSDVIENVSVKVEWSDFPVLFEHPGDADIRMMVAPFITN